MGIPTGSLRIYLYLHLALMLLFSYESFENSLDIKLTAMIDIKLQRKEFEAYGYGQSLHIAFTEMLDWTLLPFRKWNSAEQQNQALEDYQNHLKATPLVKLLELIGEGSGAFCDPLGELINRQFRVGTMASIRLLNIYAV